MEGLAQRTAWIAALGLWAVSSGAALLYYPVEQTGDGAEYSIMMFALKRHADPAITAEDIAEYDRLLRERPWKGAGRFIPFKEDPWLSLPGEEGKRWDLRHFWFYSLMAVPFSWLAEAAGMHPMAAFGFLHAALVLVVLLLTRRWQGETAALAAAILLICSPFYWYANKPHTEILTGAGLTLALAAAVSGRFAAAGLCLAVAATQNMLLAPFAALAVLLDWKRLAQRDKPAWLAAAASAFLVCLSPAYYYVRHGVASPLQKFGYIRPDLVGWKRMTTLWVDPDRGMLPLWPLALPLLLLSAWLIARAVRRDGFGSLLKPLPLFIGIYFIGVHPGTAIQLNWNMGGSLLVQRYCFFLIPLGWLALVRWVQSPRPVALGLLMLLSLWSVWIYQPSRPEATGRFNAFSEWLYANFPSVYDPDPDVFLSRACGEPIPYTGPPGRRLEYHRWRCKGVPAVETGMWAAGDPSCRKIFVSGEGLAAQQGSPASGPIAGCAASVDRSFIASRILSCAPAGGGDFYVSLSPEDANEILPLLPVRGAVDFGHPASEPYLRRGWSGPEGWGRWSDGDSARIVARLPEPGASQWKVLLELDAFVAGSKSQEVKILVNGLEVARERWEKPEIRRIVLPNVRRDRSLLIDLVPSAPYDGDPPLVNDGRRLGVAIRKMWIENREAAGSHPLD